MFKEREVRTKFLLARGSWMKSSMQGTDSSDAYAFANKCIDVSRLALFDIMSQFRAVFADDQDAAQGIVSALSLSAVYMILNFY